MSGKIKAKDLSYDSTLPPFLQKLHDKNAGRGDTDRHERQIARPRKTREADDEDEPTVVDEHGELLSREELKSMSDRAPDADERSATIDAAAIPPGSTAKAEDSSRPSVVSNVAATFAPKKRKLAKAVGESLDRDTDAADNDDTISKTAKKPKKSRKPKLAFEDDAS
ncbi:uncharacterized protein K489DRAFT_405763 [Dissoconium aciculare CBS 342.82]|uniref:DUF4604 domain-containing protein n=1 Tax=Dissoconium aciculare CBS 342.82 TaxID=1314786 RepID=A0A6J3MGL0_9PEZI|nr:uncharacterized protein K489DRAFT_405763 [Dissoconium aciculare CBS 342.82]KAF1827008.1 hypothetical protein K489DRAFT_405763 [Dissoconium aciculare CBS 342.82]